MQNITSCFYCHCRRTCILKMCQSGHFKPNISENSPPQLVKGNLFYIHVMVPPCVDANRTYLGKLIHDCPDFPKQGILFRDINPVFRDITALNYISNEFYSKFGSWELDYVGGIESRGFVIATA